MTERKQGEFLMKGSAVVEARNVSRVFRLGSLTIEALKNVTLELHVGEFVVLSGASGSRKTTLLNLIGGLDKPTSGEIIIFGTRLNDLDEESLASLRCSRIGYMFQDFNLVSTLTARENLELARELAGFLAKDSVDTINHLLEAVGVSAY